MRELSIIVKINFDGLRYVTYDAILAELHEQKSDVKIGDPYEPQKSKKALRVILEYLRNRGFVDAKVFITEKEESAATVIVSFIIDEQPNDDSNVYEIASIGWYKARYLTGNSDDGPTCREARLS